MEKLINIETNNNILNKEKNIMQIALNQWNFIDYYINQTLDYCKKSQIMSQIEIDELKITRIEKY
jgi:hypothetical protein